MKRSRPLSAQAIRVLSALAGQPTVWRYGYDLGDEVRLKSGSLYPILIRLEDRGLLEASWEQSVPGRPPRHLYRVTTAGLDESARLLPAAAPARRTVTRRQLRGA